MTTETITNPVIDEATLHAKTARLASLPEFAKHAPQLLAHDVCLRAGRFTHRGENRFLVRAGKRFFYCIVPDRVTWDVAVYAVDARDIEQLKHLYNILPVRCAPLPL